MCPAAEKGAKLQRGRRFFLLTPRERLFIFGAGNFESNFSLTLTLLYRQELEICFDLVHLAGS